MQQKPFVFLKPRPVPVVKRLTLLILYSPSTARRSDKLPSHKVSNKNNNFWLFFKKIKCFVTNYLSMRLYFTRLKLI